MRFSPDAHAGSTPAYAAIAEPTCAGATAREKEESYGSTDEVNARAAAGDCERGGVRCVTQEYIR